MSVIGETKKKVIKDIVNDDEIMTTMGNDLNGRSNDEAIYQYIFPYFHIIKTIEEVHSYICMQMDMIQNDVRSVPNKLVSQYVLTIYVVVHQGLMKMSNSGGEDRLDYLANLICEKFDGRDDFGIGEFELMENQENSLDANHRLRVLTFLTKDTAGNICD